MLWPLLSLLLSPSLASVTPVPRSLLAAPVPRAEPGLVPKPETKRTSPIKRKRPKPKLRLKLKRWRAFALKPAKSAASAALAPAPPPRSFEPLHLQPSPLTLPDDAPASSGAGGKADKGAAKGDKFDKVDKADKTVPGAKASRAADLPSKPIKETAASASGKKIKIVAVVPAPLAINGAVTAGTGTVTREKAELGAPVRSARKDSPAKAAGSAGKSAGGKGGSSGGKAKGGGKGGGAKAAKNDEGGGGPKAQASEDKKPAKKKRDRVGLSEKDKEEKETERPSLRSPAGQPPALRLVVDGAARRLPTAAVAPGAAPAVAAPALPAGEAPWSVSSAPDLSAAQPAGPARREAGQDWVLYRQGGRSFWLARGKEISWWRDESAGVWLYWREGHWWRPDASAPGGALLLADGAYYSVEPIPGGTALRQATPRASVPFDRGGDETYVSSDGAWLVQVSGPGRDAYLFADAARPRQVRYLGRAPSGLVFRSGRLEWTENGDQRTETLAE